MTNKIISIKSKACPIDINNVDTDQIIPARYLKSISFNGIEDGLFYDLRFDKNNNYLNFVTDDKKYENHEIYFTGKNFGCGSSREHAPQAIKRSGIKAIIAESFSEIFFGNSISMGLVCLCASNEDIKKMIKFIQNNPNNIFEIDIKKLQLIYENEKINLKLDPIIQELFLQGNYDPLEMLLSKKNEIIEFENNL